MKKRLHPLIIVGAVIIAAGAIIVASAGASLLSGHSGSGSFVRVSGNEYTSENISMSNNSVLFVLNSTKNFHLVESSSLSLINSTNVGRYSVSPAPGNIENGSGYSIQGGPNATLFANITGNYTIVSFSKTPPQISYMIEGNKFSFLNVGLSGILGGALMFVGVPLFIYGIYAETRRRREDHEIFELMNK